MIKLSILELIILLVVALAVLFKLYSSFGTESKGSGVKIVLKPVDKSAEKQILENISRLIDDKNEQINTLSAEQNTVVSLENELNKEIFLNGARKVFELVLGAFSKGDLSPVRELMSKKVYDAFNQAIDERKNGELSTEVDFICFEKSEIKEIKKLKNTMKIVVEFVSEQVNLLKNKNGEVIEGDENFVQKITDMWTFERPLDAKNNLWTLVSTKKRA